MIVLAAASLFATTASVSALSIGDSTNLLENTNRAPSGPRDPIDPDEPSKPSDLGKVNIDYRDLDGNKIEDSDVVGGRPGTSFNIKPKVIEDWKLAATFGDSNGIFEFNPQTVTYYYEPNFYNPILDDSQLGEGTTEIDDEAPTIPDVSDDSTYILNENVESEEQQQDQEIIQEYEENQKHTDSPYYVNITSKIVATKYPSKTNWAGGQPTRGYRLATGGFLSWRSAGGPTYTVSSGFPGISVGINLGSKGGTDASVRIPKTGYWKLQVKRTWRVQKRAFYGALYSNPKGPKKFLYYGYTKVPYSYKLTPVKR